MNQRELDGQCARDSMEKDLAGRCLREQLDEAIPVGVFKSEVAAWARRIGVEPRELHVRSMTRKWASCSTRGRLTFDTDLLRQAASFRAEVIAHELLHLKVPNHGKVFKALLSAHLANCTVKV